MDEERMSDGQRTMTQSSVVIDREPYVLAQGQDLGDLRRRVVEAVQAGGGFVDFTVVGNRSMAVLVTHTTRLVITTAEVLYDERDTGDTDFPYGGMFDYI